MYCKCDTTGTYVAQLSILGKRRSKDLLVSLHHFMLPSITQYLFASASISSYNRALCVCQNSVCLRSVMDLNRILFVSKGKQLDQCMCVCVHGLVGFCVPMRKSKAFKAVAEQTH